MKQTAIEFLIEMLDLPTNNYLIEQAKEMEKQQIIKAFKEGYNDSRTPKQYYKETFKQKQK